MILAIDCGSTSFKASVFDKTLNAVSEGTHKLTYVYPQPKCVELEPTEVFAGFSSCLQQALDGVDVTKLEAIAFTSQAQTFSVFNSAGTPKCNFISWLDQRAETTCMSVAQELPDFGNHCSFGTLLSAIQLCLLRHQIDTKAITVAPDDKVISLISALVKVLCDDYYIDNNLAAMQGFYSLSENNWWDRALACCGLTAGQQASLVGVGEVATTTTDAAQAFGLPAGIPIIMAGNDQTAGAYGVELHP